jgi:hypothetical protein
MREGASNYEMVREGLCSRSTAAKIRLEEGIPQTPNVGRPAVKPAAKTLTPGRGLYEAKAGSPPAGPTPADVEEMRRAAVECVVPEDELEEPLELVWKRAEVDKARNIRKANEGCQFRWRSPAKHLLLACVSDQHIGGKYTDFKAMREDAELIRDTPNCFAVLAGDAVDNHIKHRSAALAADSIPDEQYKLFEYYLGILGDKSLLLVGGNHDFWSPQIAGIDMLARISRDRRLCYAPDVAYLDIGVGVQEYVIGVRHQYRFNSSFNYTHTIKQWLRMGERPFDVGVIGHHHEHAVESFIYRNKLCWGCRPGSYQITSAYSRQGGFNAAIPTTPTFLLRGDRREIIGFATLRAAVEFTAAAREIGVA